MHLLMAARKVEQGKKTSVQRIYSSVYFCRKKVVKPSAAILDDLEIIRKIKQEEEKNQKQLVELMILIKEDTAERKQRYNFYRSQKKIRGSKTLVQEEK